MTKKKDPYRGSVIKNVAFFGDAMIPKSDPVYKNAFETAKLLASRGYTIVNGGGSGVMNASTQGAESVHGETISVVFYPKETTSFEGRYLRNITDREIKTSNYIERMFKLLEHGDMFIIFKGGTGTISEFGTAWALAKLYYGHHKPFVLFGNFWKKIIEVFRKNMNLDKKELDVLSVVDDKEDILEVICNFEREHRGVAHDHCKFCKERVFVT
jgi:uncharacterized protein (TIGR00730 family)